MTTFTPLTRLCFLLPAVLAVAAVLLLVRVGSVPLLDPDESRFARTSVEMMRGGDPVVPHFKGEPRLVKPPLVHWIQAFLFGWFGVTEWVARLHAVLAVLGSLALAGAVAGRRFGPEGAAWAAAILGTMPLAFVPGRLGTLDALLAVHVLAAVALDLEAPVEGGSYRPLALGAILGLAFLVKGPVGVILPLLLMLAGRTATGRAVLPGAGAVLQAAAGWTVTVLPWGLAFLARIGSGDVLGVLRGEVLERYFTGTTHVEPFWFYARVAAVGFLPWLAPLCIGVVRSIRLRKLAVARTALYASAALLTGLVFFSLGRSKLPSYIVPLAPLAAWIVTWELAREIEEAEESSTGIAWLSGSVAALAVLLGLAGTLQLDGAPRTTALAGAAIFGVSAAVAALGVVRRRPRRVYGAIASGTATFLLVVVGILFPALGERKSAAALIDAVPELRSGRPIVTVEIKVPSLTFYADRATEVIEMHQWEARAAAADDPLFVLADVDLEAAPRAVLGGLREIGRYEKLVVFEGI